MTKIVLSVVGALCAFAFVMATPVYRVPEVTEPELQFLQLAADPNFKINWFNPTEVLEAIENVLRDVQEKIKQVGEEVESVVDDTLEEIGQKALEAAAKWNATVQDLVRKAHEAGIDVQDCILEAKPLSDVVEELKAEAKECVHEPIEEMYEALDDMKATGTEAQEFLQTANQTVSDCIAKGDFVEVTGCLVGAAPELQVRAMSLVVEVGTRSAKVAIKAAAIPGASTLCTSQATASCAAEASRIVNGTITCIQNKLHPSS